MRRAAYSVDQWIAWSEKKTTPQWGVSAVVSGFRPMIDFVAKAVRLVQVGGCRPPLQYKTHLHLYICDRSRPGPPPSPTTNVCVVCVGRAAGFE